MPNLLPWLRRRPPNPAAADLEKRATYQTLFGTASGQEVLADLLRRTGVLLPSFGDGDARADAYREGQRAVGLYLIRMTTESPEAADRLAMTGQTEALTE